MILNMSFSKWYHYKIFLERGLFSVFVQFFKNKCMLHLQLQKSHNHYFERTRALETVSIQCGIYAQ